MADPFGVAKGKPVLARGTEVPITPEVLDWAIRESGFEPADVAAQLEVPRSLIQKWLSGEEKPRMTQFRRLASYLKRPEAAFLLPRPPSSTQPPIKFRHLPGEESRDASPKERVTIRQASRLQEALTWILEELGAERPHLPRASTQEDAEVAAERTRRLIGISEADQLGWRTPYSATREWRDALERIGIAVLLLPMGPDSVRGFSIWDPRIPLIAANTHWNPQARAFSLFHEFGHLLTRTNSLCAPVSRVRALSGGDKIERWCEEFAAAVLLPWEQVATALREDQGWKQGIKITDLSVASWLARRFKASLRATVIRLIGHGAADWDLYREIPPISDQKSGGGAPGEPRRRPEIRIGQYGRRTTSLFFDALSRDVISRDDVLSYLDVADTDLRRLENLSRRPSGA